MCRLFMGVSVPVPVLGFRHGTRTPSERQGQKMGVPVCRVVTSMVDL